MGGDGKLGEAYMIALILSSEPQRIDRFFQQILKENCTRRHHTYVCVHTKTTTFWPIWQQHFKNQKWILKPTTTTWVDFPSKYIVHIHDTFLKHPFWNKQQTPPGNSRRGAQNRLRDPGFVAQGPSKQVRLGCEALPGFFSCVCTNYEVETNLHGSIWQLGGRKEKHSKPLLISWRLS